MKTMIAPSFSFPKGGIAGRTVSSCLDSLEAFSKGELSPERIIDFCICQVYAISGFNTDYLRKWNASHSFGGKAQQRFERNNSKKKYYEDIWLSKKGLSRADLLEFVRERRCHPLAKFIFPEYEEGTKSRLHNTEAGFLICQISTLMYTPFSPSCQTCVCAEICKRITESKYQELYRIRNEEYNKK